MMIRDILRDKKGDNILLFDVRGISGVTDCYILVSGNSHPHMKAMFDEVQHRLKQTGIYCYRRAGNPESGWMVLDYFDVIIHIFSGEVRRRYGIEELWSDARRME